MKSKWSYNSPIGEIWIAQDQKTITYIEFSHDEHILNDYAMQETPLIIETGRQLKEYFAGNRQHFTIPIALAGTPFQQSVWEALLKIPYGQTCSYKDIAIQIGNPKAARAVGMANNRNPIAIIVPCHRVIGHNGSLIGYAGGLSIKEHLLNLEKSPTPEYFHYGEKEINYLKSRDPILGKAIEEIGPIKRLVTADIFMALVKSIIGQQISTKAQKSIWNKVQTQIRPINPETIARLSVTEIQAFGISGRKATYIKDMADNILSGNINLLELGMISDEEVCERLTKFKGVGIWTAEMMMLFSLERPNILSWGDLAIHRGLRMLYQHPEITREIFSYYKELYSPFASVASLYLWEIASGTYPEYKDPILKEK